METSQTKQILTKGLKILLLKKNFMKITVTDVRKQSGLNRQTFYYHFQDKYALLHWIYYHEAMQPTMEGITFANWNTHHLTFLHILQADQAFYIRTIRNE